MIQLYRYSFKLLEKGVPTLYQSWNIFSSNWEHCLPQNLRRGLQMPPPPVTALDAQQKISYVDTTIT